MSATAGQIDLDLNLDQSGFNSQLKGIEKSATSAGDSISSSLGGNLTSLAKKAGAAIAAAFAVNKIVDFAKECLELGSNLAEVQNVVDVTFSSMSESVNEWAAAAADAYGLSETMAKQYVGTFGSMAEAFGFTESEAYEMSTALTGLVGDVASFYNLDQDTAYTKLKAVFSGETESLKDLGIVMTQTALDSYAMANGFGKTTSEMTEAEKVTLRMAFVTDQLSNAQGDFARTSDSWANQTRILELRMDSLKATIGQGLINAFTPALKAINAVILKLEQAAEAFEEFTELVFGYSESGSSTSSVSESVDSATESTDALTESAEAAAEAIQSLMGFDKINKLDDEDSSDSSDDTDASTVTTTDSGSSTSGSSEETVLDNVSAALDKVIAKAKELKSLFLAGFSVSFGDSEEKIEQIKLSLSDIGSTLTEIFTDPSVTTAANEYVNSIAYSMGQITGSVASVGVSIGYNLASGISQSLEENKGYIEEKLTNIFTLTGDTWSVAGDFTTTLGDIVSEALSSDSAVSITSSIKSIFTTAFLGTTELASKFGNDVVNMIAQPIIDNKDKISEAIENTLAPIATVIDTVKTAVTDAFTIMGEVYDEHISPMLTKFKEGFSDSFGKILDLYNQYIAPVLQQLADKFTEVYENNIKPAMENIGTLVGKVFDLIGALYENILKPLFDWIAANVMPIIAQVVSVVGGTLLNAFALLSDGISVVAGFLSGLIDALISVISNVGSIPEAFSNAATAIKNAFKNIGTWFSDKATAVVNAFKNIPTKIKTFFTNAYTNVKNVFKSIGTWFSDKATAVVNAFKNIPSNIKTKFTNAWTNVKNVFSGIGTWFSDKATAVVDAFKNIPSNIKTKFTTAWTNVKSVFSLSTITTFFTSVKDKIVGIFSKIGSSIGTAVSDSFSSAMNTVFETVENIVNTFIKAINGAISIINNIPGVNISKLSEVELPRLAEGGYVEANTPQLAMIGDNRHQGEVVAPEDKLADLAKQGALLAGAGSSSPEILELLKKIVKLLEEFDFDVYLDGESVKSKIVKRINRNTKATGVCEIII